MLYITDITESQKIFQALSSPVRLQIIKLLHQGKEKNINDLANTLKLSNSALTAHIKMLSDCGLIKIRLVSISHGTQKLCSLTEDKLLIELIDKNYGNQYYDIELNVGQYTKYKVNPPCGLGTAEGLIGGLDGPQYFAYPQRFNAEIIWYTDGYVTYTFPNPLKIGQVLTELQFTMEIGGEAPGAVEDFPTNIDYSINNIFVGRYICPGELFDRQGRFTPSWWPKNFGQYGRLRVITINNEGTLFNGVPTSDIKLSDLKLEYNHEIDFKISCEDRKDYIGGITIFGKKFGDHPQGIKLRAIYTE